MPVHYRGSTVPKGQYTVCKTSNIAFLGIVSPRTFSVCVIFFPMLCHLEEMVGCVDIWVLHKWLRCYSDLSMWQTRSGDCALLPVSVLEQLSSIHLSCCYLKRKECMILSAVKILTFWHVNSCSLVDVFQRNLQQ